MHGSSSFLVQKGCNFRATSGENHLDHVLARSKQTPFFLPEDIQVKQNRRHAWRIDPIRMDRLREPFFAVFILECE
jgi:hypothetical protein